jgi:hypothetical protein
MHLNNYIVSKILFDDGYRLILMIAAKKEQDKVDSIAPLVPDPGVLEQLDQQVDRLIRALPSGTALMVLSGHGDTREALA